MTTYDEVFDEKQYKAINDKAVAMYLDLNVSGALPLIKTELFDAYKYLHPTLAEATGGGASLDYNEKGRKMSVMHAHEEIELYVHDALIQVRQQDIWKYGESLIADKYEAMIEHLVKQIDDSAFHGPKDEFGIRLAQGLLGQLTTKEDLTSGNGHDCSGKGEIWHVIREMIFDIPLAMRQTSEPMILYINEKTISEAKAPDRIYQDKVEWNFIYDEFMGPEAAQGQKIGQVIVTNKINAEALDDTADTSNGADTADTLGTDGRILLFVPNAKWGGRVESAGFHKKGEEQHMLSVDILLGWHGRFYVFDEDAYVYTERLSF